MPQRERRSPTARIDDLFLRLATALLARDARPRSLVWGSFESSRSAVGTPGLTRARPRSVSVHAPRRSRRIKPQMAASSSASRTSNVWRPSSRATASLDRGPSSRRVRRISSSSTSRSLMGAWVPDSVFTAADSLERSCGDRRTPRRQTRTANEHRPSASAIRPKPARFAHQYDDTTTARPRPRGKRQLRSIVAGCYPPLRGCLAAHPGRVSTQRGVASAAAAVSELDRTPVISLAQSRKRRRILRDQLRQGYSV
jgi:hypothetical protein